LNSQLIRELLSTVVPCCPYLSFHHSSVVKVLASSSIQRTKPTHALTSALAEPTFALP